MAGVCRPTWAADSATSTRSRSTKTSRLIRVAIRA
nr:MAG TPA: hypothetical protein [Caudoviricetes sp.]